MGEAGRTLNSWQWAPLNCTTDASGAYLLTYTYDFLGDVMSLNNRREGVNYIYSYDTAGRLT